MLCLCLNFVEVHVCLVQASYSIEVQLKLRKYSEIHTRFCHSRCGMTLARYSISKADSAAIMRLPPSSQKSTRLIGTVISNRMVEAI